MECVSAVACLAPASAGASIPVNGGPGVAVTPDSVRGQRFAEMLQAEPQRENVYVAGPDVEPRSSNPLVAVMSQFQSLELTNGSPPPTSTYERSGNGGEPDSDADLASPNQDLLDAQAGLLRTAMMMEVMSSAKQGVTTLFQQQG
jgi:hypothetical protein